MTFEQLNLVEPILTALQKKGYTNPTPIQAQAIPPVLEGNDLLGCAQTGTGKTAAFSIPIIQKFYNDHKDIKRRRPQAIKALVLTPTRELAIQIDESFRDYGHLTDLKHAVIYGGVGQRPQTDALRAGVDVLIATPGRLLDLINQGYIRLNNIEFFVLDEADRMLDMGFIHDIKRILPLLPKARQTLFFSATMPKDIANLADSILYKPVKVEVTPASSTVDLIEQSIYFVEKTNKKNLLVELLQNDKMDSVLVFAATKHGSDKLEKMLEKEGIKTQAIHGNKSQNARQNALNNFKNHKTRVLIATDIAARGIDVNSLSYVVNYDLPNVPETYVHRIGRTGRAGKDGTAIAFCSPEEKILLRDIQRLIGKTIPVVEEHPFVTEGSSRTSEEMAKSNTPKPKQQRNSGQGSGSPRKTDSSKRWFSRK